MPSGFQKIRFSVTDKGDDELASVGTRSLAHRGIGAARRGEEASRTFESDEAAARFYLGRVLGQDDRPRVRGLTAPERTESVPDMRLRHAQAVPGSNNRLLTFDQTKSAIPIFGSRVVVQLDENRELVQIGGDVADISGVSPVASLSPAEALQRVVKLTSASDEQTRQAQPPQLMFFHNDETQSWHLAYFIEKFPAAPPSLLDEIKRKGRRGHGLGLSPRELRPLMNYLVDAHDGSIIFYYSATPMIDVPSVCRGIAEIGGNITFFGRLVGNQFEMVDPRRSIKTLDMKGKDIDIDPVPQDAVRNASNDWQETNKAAVSAHAHATKVYNFYKSVLLRDGIDNKGMDLVSIVNCTYNAAQSPPEWHNAVWFDNKMWYGQNQAGGSLRSFSRFLDVIAHELTHGVTQHTSNLVYRNQSGALNESFSDIFGIIIANWDPTDPDRDVSTWTWELGAGLGENGKPLRDLSDPRRTGDPDHMNDYLKTMADEGGVHTNSNIHNKAAYNVLTATDANGKRVFRPMEVAEVYYLTLCSLSSLATFSDTLDELVEVASTYYAGNPTERASRIAHLKDAYGKVGITSS